MENVLISEEYFTVTITYDTSPDKIEQAIGILRNILDNHPGMDEEFPPRVYFDELNSNSLNIKCFYWFHPPDYWQYMEFTQKVNQEIITQFNSAGIHFAFPTQTIHLAGNSAANYLQMLRNGSSANRASQSVTLE